MDKESIHFCRQCHNMTFIHLNEDDKLIHAIVLKFFHDNQIIVTPDVINFILNRISRNFNEIQIFLDKLNDLSIKHKSKISIPFLNKFFSF